MNFLFTTIISPPPDLLISSLTRMLQNAMEVYGVQGLFKTTCNNTLTLLRDNSQSILVRSRYGIDNRIDWKIYFILIVRLSWKHSFTIRWLRGACLKKRKKSQRVSKVRLLHARVVSFLIRAVDDHTFHSRRTPLEEEGEPTNQRAMEVIDRIKLKLCGRDFNVNQVKHWAEWIVIREASGEWIFLIGSCVSCSRLGAHREHASGKADQSGDVSV